MLDSIFIRRKLRWIQEDLKKLEQFREFTFEEMSKDWMRWSVLEWTLVKIIGRAIDINQHLIAELGGKNIPPPKDYTETFILLKNINVIPEKFIEEIAKSAGFRNRIIHEYNEIDKNLVYKTVGEAIAQYAEYCKFVLEFLDKHKTSNDGL